MKNHGYFSLLAGAIVTLIVACDGGFSAAMATPPPSEEGTPIPQHVLDRLRDMSTKRGFLNLTRSVRANQAAILSGARAADSAGAQVSGRRFIPVLMGKYSNTASDPFPISDLQRELFDGPFPTGTMTELYKEVSYGNLDVTGTVFPWKTLPKTDVNYTGAPLADGTPCNGLCDNARLGDFLKDMLNKYIDEIDFTKYDNDGPDGIPNSGDDDGFVDFVAIVHPAIGGECGRGNNNIWSHRSSFQSDRNIVRDEIGRQEWPQDPYRRLCDHAGESLRRHHDDPDRRVRARVRPRLRPARPL